MKFFGSLVPLAILLCVHLSSQGNILGLFPHHGYSHFKVFQPILEGLVQRGHSVTVVTYIGNPEKHPNYTELLLTGKKGMEVYGVDDFTPKRSLAVMFKEFMALHSEGQESCRLFFESGVVEEIFTRHHQIPYNLAIVENFNTDCYLGVPHLLRVPVIGVSSCALMPWHYDRIALPDTPSHVQTEFVGFPERLDWRQRLINLIVTKSGKLMYRYYTNWRDNQVIQKYLKINVDVREIAADNVSVILVNQHYSLSGNRPSTPQLIEIGGIHINQKNMEKEEEDPLPQQIETFLANSPNGVVFISWGSMLRASSISADKLKDILYVLRKIPLRVIWKWETDNVPTHETEKIFFTKWAPQRRLLCHPKVKVFWSHGGLLGITEAVHCAKPMLVTPFYGDQFLNGNSVENRQIGKIIAYDDISPEQLLAALQEVMQPSFTENAAAISKIFRNRQTTPIATAMWWIEHVLSGGKLASDILRTQAVHMNWFLYHSLDSIVIILVVLVILIVMFVCGIKLLLRLMLRNSKILKGKYHTE